MQEDAARRYNNNSISGVQAAVMDFNCLRVFMSH